LILFTDSTQSYHAEYGANMIAAYPGYKGEVINVNFDMGIGSPPAHHFGVKVIGNYQPARRRLVTVR
jgi:hypothetical protein